MELTLKQQEGLKIALERYKRREKYTVISGYAGAGKSTLVRFIIEALYDYGIEEEHVAYATFTGKAAQVLARKGNANVFTLHKLLYDSFPRPDGTFSRRPKKDIGFSVVVVDEVSMAPKTLMDLLFSHRVHVICLGDPFQLPPIDKNEDNELLAKPHIFLDEIMRQAKESEIIRLTMAIRNHEDIPYMMGDEVRIHSYSDYCDGMLTWADQVLVGTNKKRIELNNTMRQMLSREGDLPVEGDKLICLRNYWGVLDSDGNDLINGTIGYVNNTFQTSHYLPNWCNPNKIAVTYGDLTSEINTKYGNLQMDTNMIITGDKCVTRADAYKLDKNAKTRGLIPLEFAYGYAITCHKSQGSEWDNVLVMEEAFPFAKEEHARWLYTACTRASKKLVLVR